MIRILAGRSPPPIVSFLEKCVFELNLGDENLEILRRRENGRRRRGISMCKFGVPGSFVQI